jgi:hypothetical protein
LRPGRSELLVDAAVWEALERRGATVSFTGWAGEGGTIVAIVLGSLHGDELVDVDRWIGREELAYALATPLWDRFGLFAGQPRTVGTVTWTAADRSVVITGRRGGERFEEAA